MHANMLANFQLSMEIRATVINTITEGFYFKPPAT
jgi:hypothetical protein